MLRRFIWVFILFILTLSLLFGLYIRSRLDSLAQQFLPRLKQRLSEELGADIAIRGARIGLLNHLTLEELSISIPSKFGEITLLEVEEAHLYYKLLDIASVHFREPRLILIRDGKLEWEAGDFLIERDHIDGSIEVKSPTEAKVSFYSEDREGGSFSLYGTIHPGRGDHNLTLELSHLEPGWGHKPMIPLTNISGTLLLNEGSVRSEGLSASIGELLVELNGEVSECFTNPHLDCLIRSKSRFGETNFLARGDLRHPYLDGSFNLLDRVIFPFRADVDFGERVLTIEVGPKDELKLLARLGKSFEAALVVKHLKFNNLDLVTELNLVGDLLREEDGKVAIVGRLSSKNSILDYKPFMELEGTYRIEGTTLKIPTLSLGDTYRVTGTVGLRDPFPVELTIEMDGSDVTDLLIFAKGVKEGGLSGKVEGKIDLKGPASSPKIEGRCIVKDGTFGEIQYRSMVVNLDGEGRLIEIKDSRIYQEEGTLILGGEIDLAKANPCEGVVIRSGEERIIWKGWKITRPEGSEELSMGKAVGEDFRINFKTYLNDELSARDIQDDELTLEYGVSQSQRIKVKLKEDEEFLGLEHKLEF